MSLFGYPEPTQDEQRLRIGDTVWTVHWPYTPQKRTVDVVKRRDFVNGAIRFSYHLTPFRIDGPNELRNDELGKAWFLTEDAAKSWAEESRRRCAQGDSAVFNCPQCSGRTVRRTGGPWFEFERRCPKCSEVYELDTWCPRCGRIPKVVAAPMPGMGECVECECGFKGER